MLRRVRAVVILGWAVVPALVGPAWSQDDAAAGTPSPVGTVEAVSYSPIPAGAGLATQANDSSALTDDALRRVNATLSGRGYRVDNKSNLVLTVETQLVRGVRQDTPVGQLTATNNVAIVQGKLYSSTQNSLLNPTRPISSEAGIYRINLSVYDRTTGIYVWRGSINRSDPSVDIDKAGDQMVPALLDYLGKTEKPATP